MRSNFLYIKYILYSEMKLHLKIFFEISCTNDYLYESSPRVLRSSISFQGRQSGSPTSPLKVEENGWIQSRKSPLNKKNKVIKYLYFLN